MTLITNQHLAELVQPGMSALYHPATGGMARRVALGRDVGVQTTLGDVERVASVLHRLAAGIVVIAPILTQVLRQMRRVGTHNNDGIQHIGTLAHIGNVGSGDGAGDGTGDGN